MKKYIFSTAADWISELYKGAPVSIMPSKIAAELLGDTPSSISKKLSSGEIGLIEIGGRRYVSSDAVAERVMKDISLMNEVQSELEHIAMEGGTIFYSDLMAKFGMRWQSPPDRKKIGVLLGNISKQTYRERKVLLSALVHRKSPRPTNPGPGYFSLLEELVRTVEGFAYNKDDERLVELHMIAVWKSYGQKK